MPSILIIIQIRKSYLARFGQHFSFILKSVQTLEVPSVFRAPLSLRALLAAAAIGIPPYFSTRYVSTQIEKIVIPVGSYLGWEFLIGKHLHYKLLIILYEKLIDKKVFISGSK